MPIHDLGYRAWTGQLRSGALRWWVITETGVRLALRSRWLRRLLLVAWLPAFYFGAAFFGYEQWLAHEAEQQKGLQRIREIVLEEAGDSAAAEAGARLQEARKAARAVESPAAKAKGRRSAVVKIEPHPKAARTGRSAAAKAERRRTPVGGIEHQLQGLLPGIPISGDRHSVWSWLLWIFFRYPQGMLMLLVVGLVGPPLIARDVGSRAFLLYFSRPVARVEYVIGKLAVVWGFLLMICTAPAVTLYIVGVLLSPDLKVVSETWDIPLRVLATSAVLLVPTAAMALACSSLTAKTWQASFAWFAVWVFGMFAYSVLAASLEGNLDERWMLISLYHCLGKVENWIFGLGATFQDIIPYAAMLAGLTVVSLATLFRRVSAPMRQ